MSEELRAALQALPEVEDVERAMDVALLVRVEGEFAPARVLGTIAVHGWGAMSVSQAFPVVIEAWPCAPSEIPAD